MILPALELELVVEGDLLAGGDVAQRDDPDASVDDVGGAVRFAGVVGEAGDVPVEVAVSPPSPSSLLTF